MYHQMIGSLMYLMNMRQNICFAVNTLNQYLTDLRHVNLTAANHILRYLKGTVDYGLNYKIDQRINLEGYVDSYWAVSSIDRKGTSGCFFSMGSDVISWFRRKDSFMPLSTEKEKYVATFSTTWERGAVKLHFVI